MKYINQFDVICLDMEAIIGTVHGERAVAFLVRSLTEELKLLYPDLQEGDAFFSTLASAVELSGHKIVMIIDGWDAPIRESKSLQEERGYLEFLRSLFKNSGTTAKSFAAVYMTGILPIKKGGSQ